MHIDLEEAGNYYDKDITKLFLEQVAKDLKYLAQEIEKLI